MFKLRPLLLLGILFLFGCGASDLKSVSVTPVQPPAPTDQAKSILENVAQTGEAGSGTAELRSLFEQIKQADAAKGDALLNELPKLESAKSPAEAQAAAKKMLGQL